LWRADSLAAEDGTHSGNDIRSRRVLQQIACYAGTDRSNELLFAGLHTNENNFAFGQRCTLGGKTCP
jgi:hypothetical protein